MDNILNFPTTTIVNKPVPKNTFWQRAERQTAMKDFLTEEFESITWLYKLAASTLNVADGESVHEIDVFYCKMKNDFYSINPFCAMDKLLPRHTLYIIEYGEATDIIMHHKEVVTAKGERQWKCGVTEMLRGVDFSKTSLKIEGQTMDAVYNSLLSQISGLKVHDNAEYAKLSNIRFEIITLEKQLSALQNKIKKEKQYARQIKLNSEVRKMKERLNNLRIKLSPPP